LVAARNAAPAKHREDTLQQEMIRVQKSMARLLTAYQEGLLSLDELRRRLPELRKREQAAHAELTALEGQLADRAGYLRVADTVTSFLARLREAANTLDIRERQRITRLLVKQIFVADDAIIIRHSIPATTGGSGSSSTLGGGQQPVANRSYPLRTGSHRSSPLAGMFTNDYCNNNRRTP
jgi:site-specific DNA recombinase